MDPSARHPEFTRLETSEGLWKIEQTLVDPDGHNDWMLELEADPQCLQEGAKPALIFKAVREIV
jgi:hypothetical protein